MQHLAGNGVDDDRRIARIGHGGTAGQEPGDDDCREQNQIDRMGLEQARLGLIGQGRGCRKVHVTFQVSGFDRFSRILD